MPYQDSVERSTELLRKALPLMSRQAAALHPTSYALWYAYVAQDNAALRDAVDQHLARHGTLDEAATEALYRRHLAEPDAGSTQQLAEGMQRLLVGMSDTAAQANDHTARFGQALQRLSAELAVDSSLATDVPTLNALRDRTQDMQGAMDQLARRLADSQREIDTLRAEVSRARTESLLDALTGLPNRRAFDQRLAACLATQAAVAPNASPCLLMLDIDHFKRINDSYGHPFGDQVLRGLAQVLKASVAEPMVAARVGGEEFAVLLPAGRLAQAEALAERLRSAIAASRIRRKGQDDAIERITVSLGVALAQPGDTAHAFIDRADRALYRSKAGGRDQVTVAG